MNDKPEVLGIKEKPEAWNGASWGMAFKQVNSLFKNKLRKVEYPISVCPSSIRDSCAAFEMIDYKIGKENYNVEFEFLDNQLSKIVLKCESDNNSKDWWRAAKCSDNITYLLTQKYGNPVKEEDSEKEGGEYLKTKTTYRHRKLEWKSTYSVIDLYFYTCNGDCGTDKFSAESLGVKYSPDPNKARINTKFYTLEKDKV